MTMKRFKGTIVALVPVYTATTVYSPQKHRNTPPQRNYTRFILSNGTSEVLRISLHTALCNYVGLWGYSVPLLKRISSASSSSNIVPLLLSPNYVLAPFRVRKKVHKTHDGIYAYIDSHYLVESPLEQNGQLILSIGEHEIALNCSVRHYRHMRKQASLLRSFHASTCTRCSLAKGSAGSFD